MVAAGQKAVRAMLPAAVHKQIWRRLANRLERGEVLVTTVDYMRVLESEYAALTGSPATANVRAILRRAIETCNDLHPQTYLVRGVANCVSQAFRTGARRLEWDAVKIRSAGPPSIVRFTRRQRISSYLDSVRIPVELIDPDRSVRAALAGATPGPRMAARAESSPVILSDEVRLALQAGLLEQAQINNRLSTQRRQRAALRSAEQRKLRQRLEVYVELGRLSAEDKRVIEELRQLNREIAPGDPEDPDRDRSWELLPPDQQTALNAKIRGAIEYEVGYLDVYSSLRNIDEAYDDALEFLVGSEVSGKCGEVGSALTGRRELVERLNELADRTDGEVRMLAVGLPPYDNRELFNHSVNAKPEEAISFIRSLRADTVDEISERLSSADRDERLAPVAGMNRLVTALRELTSPTPLRLEVRALKVYQQVENLLRSGDDLRALRQDAQSIFSMRLRRMFADLTADEQSAIESRAAEQIESVEAKLVEERRSRRTPAPATVAAPDDASSSSAGETSLSPEEIQRGALIGRVETRVGGEMRALPHVIMVDPDQPDHFVIGQRDADGMLLPQLRHGTRSRVRKARDGSWRVVS